MGTWLVLAGLTLTVLLGIFAWAWSLNERVADINGKLDVVMQSLKITATPDSQAPANVGLRVPDGRLQP